MPHEIADHEIGGARLRMGYNTFHPDGTPWRRKAGEILTADEVRAIPRNNRKALVSNGTLDVYLANPGAQGGERFIVQVRKDQFNVIEGRKLNDHPLSREEADALAAQK